MRKHETDRQRNNVVQIKNRSYSPTLASKDGHGNVHIRNGICPHDELRKHFGDKSGPLICYFWSFRTHRAEGTHSLSYWMQLLVAERKTQRIKSFRRKQSLSKSSNFICYTCFMSLDNKTSNVDSKYAWGPTNVKQSSSNFDLFVEPLR